jgi:hypothetical protein
MCMLSRNAQLTLELSWAGCPMCWLDQLDQHCEIGGKAVTRSCEGALMLNDLVSYR